MKAPASEIWNALEGSVESGKQRQGRVTGGFHCGICRARGQRLRMPETHWSAQPDVPASVTLPHQELSQRKHKGLQDPDQARVCLSLCQPQGGCVINGRGFCGSQIWGPRAWRQQRAHRGDRREPCVCELCLVVRDGRASSQSRAGFVTTCSPGNQPSPGGAPAPSQASDSDVITMPSTHF